MNGEKDYLVSKGLETRLQFIENYLYWHGSINRKDIIREFQISVPQSSKDLTLYQQITPGNLIYDKNKKKYVASKNFRPRFYKPNPKDFLGYPFPFLALDSNPKDIIATSKFSFGFLPVFDIFIDLGNLRSIALAIRNRRSIEILYQSIASKKPEPFTCWISPHDLGFTGFRWYVRAYCHVCKHFRDFTLSRILTVRGDAEPKAYRSDDDLWLEYVNVIMVPNKSLSPTQREAIAIEYQMDKYKKIFPVRKAMLYYFAKWLHIEGKDHLKAPLDSPIVVENRDEFETSLSSFTCEDCLA